MKNISKEFFLALIEEIKELDCKCKINKEKECEILELTQTIQQSLFNDTQIKRKENNEYLIITQNPNFYSFFSEKKYNMKMQKLYKCYDTFIKCVSRSNGFDCEVGFELVNENLFVKINYKIK